MHPWNKVTYEERFPLPKMQLVFENINDQNKIIPDKNNAAEHLLTDVFIVQADVNTLHCLTSKPKNS